MKYREIIKRIEADGWYWKRTNGSHRIYKHPTKTGTVAVGAQKTCLRHGEEYLSQAALDKE
jgi:predicted RNA binding protein YcfA (HicA-like mRNA interferase family)